MSERTYTLADMARAWDAGYRSGWCDHGTGVALASLDVTAGQPLGRLTLPPGAGHVGQGVRAFGHAVAFLLCMAAA